MNKEYIYKDGKALVIDENGNQKTIDYYDNLDEVLIQEDLLETMKNKINKLEKEISQYNKGTKFSNFWEIFEPFLMFTLLPAILVPIFCYFLGGNSVVPISPIELGLCYSTFFSIPGGLLSFGMYLKKRGIEKEQKAKQTQLQYLRIEYDLKREYLEQLKLDKSNSKVTDEFYVSKVDNIQALKSLRNFLSFCYDLGYNEDKYFKYYQKGKLDSYLGEFINEFGIQFANKHFEEKEPILVKKKVNAKNTRKD